MTIRILCTGDIHIGRRSSKVSGTWRSAGAWLDVVNLAISEGVDLLAISGDIVDQESKSYEALGPLQHGLNLLDEAGIDTVAVTGNHDHDVLARLSGATGMERFHLLGVGGKWERFILTRDGQAALLVDGWSFPREHVTEPPVASYQEVPGDGVPVLGLLHGDVGVASSRYAPIDLHQLWAHSVDIWLLGHIHAPKVYEGPGRAVAFYPGSPLAMDPGEPGVHGPWMVEFRAGDAPSLRQIPLSPVRYESTTIDANGIEAGEDFQRALNEALISLGQDATTGPVEVLSVRLHVAGRTSAYRHIGGWIDRARQDIAHYQAGSAVIEIDRITADVRPHLDLEALAQGSNPAAETAKLLLALNQSIPEQSYRDLIDETVEELRAVYELAAYAPLRAGEERGGNRVPGERDARQLLERHAWQMLSSLVARKEMA